MVFLRFSRVSSPIKTAKITGGVSTSTANPGDTSRNFIELEENFNALVNAVLARMAAWISLSRTEVVVSCF